MGLPLRSPATRLWRAIDWQTVDWQSAPRFASSWATDMARLHRTLAAAVATVFAFGLLGAVPPTRAMASPARAHAAATRSAADGGVFVGTDAPGGAGAERSALLLASALGGVATEPVGVAAALKSGSFAKSGICAASRLQVSWVPPVGTYQVGAYIAPLGPRPTEATERVNGVVLCRESRYAYLGFEAAWDGANWRLRAVPASAREALDDHRDAEPVEPSTDSAEAAHGAAGELPSPSEWAGTALEPLAAYTPQTTCDPTAKPGVLGFRDLLLTTFPGTHNGHIGRPCELPGVSEHKEGRAYDWYVNAADPNERVAADTLLGWLLATDDQGNPFAMARRLGVMYVIWDGRIWSSFLADEGWRPYFGVQDHTDHVHFSFDWAGAMAQTTFWKGVSAPRAGSDIPDLPLIPVPARPPGVPALNTTVGGGGGSGPGASRAPAGPAAGSPSGPAASPSGGNPPADVGGAPEDDPAPPPPRRSPPPSSPEPAPTTTSTTTTTTAPPPVTVPTTPTTIRVGSSPF